MKKGKFFVICGGEGSGKSTVLKKIQEKFPDLVTTREPGGSPYAENIRSLMFSNALAKDATAETMFGLFWAARMDHLAHTVTPALQNGKNVLSDRFDCCTYAYQLHGQQALRLKELFWLTRLYLMEGFHPDLYIFLNVDVDVGFSRVASRNGEGNHIDRLGRDFHERVREGYTEFFSKIDNQFVIINANQPLEEVVRNVTEAISCHLH